MHSQNDSSSSEVFRHPDDFRQQRAGRLNSRNAGAQQAERAKTLIGAGGLISPRPDAPMCADIYQSGPVRRAQQ